MLRQYFFFLKKFVLPGNGLLVGCTFILTIISGLLSGIGLGLYIPVINYFIGTQKSNNCFNVLSTKIITFLHLPVTFLSLLIIATLVIMFGALITYITMLCSGYLYLKGFGAIKMRLTNDLLNRPYQYFIRQKAGKIVSIVIDQASNASSAVDIVFRYFTSLFLGLVFLVSLLLISKFLTLAMFVFGGLALILNQYFSKKNHKLSQIWQEIKHQQSHLFIETMVGIKTIKAMGVEIFRKKEISSSLENEKKNIFRKHSLFHLLPLMSKIMTTLFASLSIWLGFKVFFLSAADIIVFLMVAGRLGNNLQDINYACLDLSRSLPDIEVVIQYINWDEPCVLPQVKERFEFKDSIKIENVFFSYPGYPNVVNGINLSILKNQFIAFVGPSGEGKTTILDLIIGLYLPTKGVILYDGKPLEYYSRENWCKSIGVVTQDIFLFNDSIAKNIAYGDNNPDLKKIEEISKIAFVHDFIKDLKDGYNTFIGDRGIMLSGGQRQRVSLARALYHSPQLLILDEATSNLDSESERCIQLALERMYGSLTIIAVAHRLSTIRNADVIYCIDKGVITEKGSHNELIASDSYYRKLSLMQTT